MPLNPEETALAARLHAVLEPFLGAAAVKRIRFRLRDMGDNQADEVAQLRLLQRACREDPALSQAFVDAGLGRIGDRVLVPADAETGRLVQAFNRMVETWWEQD